MTNHILSGYFRFLYSKYEIMISRNEMIEFPFYNETQASIFFLTIGGVLDIVHLCITCLNRKFLDGGVFLKSNVILMVNYLINYIPSTLLGGEIPI